MSSSAPLGLLEVSGLIRQAGGSAEQEYIFRHTLLQDTVYESLLRDERTELHLRVGRAMEGLYSDDSNEQAAVLAEHFLKGGKPADAKKYFRRAGDQAARVYALAEALDHYGQALELAQSGHGDDGDLEYLCERRGRMLELSGQYEQALSMYQDLEDIGRERASTRLQLRGLVRRASLLCLPNPMMDLGRGEELSKKALRLAEQADDGEAQALALWNLVKKHEFTEQYSAALQAGQRALALAEELEDREQRAFIVHDLAQIHLSSGHFDDGLDAILQAQSLWRELDNMPMLADSLCNEMAIHVFRADYERALERSRQAREISERIGNLWGQSYSRYILYWVYFDRGDTAKALQVARECVELGEEAGFVVPEVQTNAEIGLMHAYMGEYEQAIEAVEQGVEKAGQYFPQWRTAILALQMLVHTFFDELGPAEELLQQVQEARSVKEQRVAGFLEFTYALALPKVQLALGHYDAVLEETQWTLRAFKEKGIKLSLADTLYYRAQALVALDETEQARSLLEESLALMQESGSRRLLWQVLLTRADLADRDGDLDRAAALRAQASEVIDYIADHSESPAQRESFLNLPAVKQGLQMAEEPDSDDG